MEYQDITIVCIERNCERPERKFTITASEQAFFVSKGYHLPKRCPKCREDKKARMNQEATDAAKRAEIRSNSPFQKVADQFRQDHPTKEFVRGQKRHNKSHQNHRRHGREEIGDFEGEQN